MGDWTITNFRDEVDRATGGKSLGSTFYDLYINAAYRELVGALEFVGSIEETTFVTVDGTANYALATDVMGVISVVDETNDLRLTWLEYKDYFSKNSDSDVEGEPTHWAHGHDNCIYLWPTPDTDDDTIRYVYMEEPAVLSDANTTTAIPATWDYAIFLLTVSNILNVTGEEDRGSIWFTRYLGYVRSRRSDRDWQKQSLSGGVEIAHSVDDLRSQES